MTLLEPPEYKLTCIAVGVEKGVGHRLPQGYRVCHEQDDTLESTVIEYNSGDEGGLELSNLNNDETALILRRGTI